MAKTRFNRHDSAFNKVLLQLKERKSKLRLRMTSRGYPVIYITSGPLKLKSCNLTGLDLFSKEQCSKVKAFCLEYSASAGDGELPPWLELLMQFEASTQTKARVPASTLTWGKLRATVKAWIAPGGFKEKDATPFNFFKDESFFGRTYEDDAPVRFEHIRDVCLYEVEGLQEGKRIARIYSSRGFHQQIQMVNTLIKKDATPGLDLQPLADYLKKKKLDRKGSQLQYIPTDEALQKHLDRIQREDPVRGWCEAMRATYGLRNHEPWHLMELPGEVVVDGIAEPTWIQVANFENDEDDPDAKTGARFSDACPVEWIERYQLNDLERSRNMLEALRKRHNPLRLTNKALGLRVTHWYNNKGHESNEFNSKLYGFYQGPTKGGVTPAPLEGRCTGYSLRHAWAHRAKRTTSWTTDYKSACMGHAPAVHERKYLKGQSRATQGRGMRNMRDLRDSVRVETVETSMSSEEFKAFQEYQAFKKFQQMRSNAS